MLRFILILLLVVVTISAQQGKYFSKKVYTETPIPAMDDARALLPLPVLEENSEWIELYWFCWETAFRGIKQPPKGSPLVSNWLDEAFSGNIFQWDTIFMMLFARYAHPVFPAIESLDNFYALQYESGFIGREFRESDGKLIHFDFDGGLFSPKGWKNMINPPLFAWAEYESYRLTGDKKRLAMVLPVLLKYAEWLDKDGDPDADDWPNNGRRSDSAVHQLYWNTPLGSGMDNTPRPAEKGAGWVEMSSQMVIMYNYIAKIQHELGNAGKAMQTMKKAQAIANCINKWCWDSEDGFYYDVLADGTRFKKKTSGGFWPLLAGIPGNGEDKRLVEHLKNEKEFWRKNVFPTLAADEDEYHPKGDYWKGGVWAPTNVMIIKGLERYGHEDLAYEATKKYLDNMYQVYQDSGTVYENYAPDFAEPSFPSKPDFVGWTGCGPIQLLIENIIGIRPDAGNNTVKWVLHRKDTHGITNLDLAGNNLTLISVYNKETSTYEVIAECTEPIKLIIESNSKTKEYQLKPVVNEIMFKE